MYSFDGKIVWVTGSSTGIGRAAALAFAQHCADVIIHGYSNLEQLKETATAIELMGRRVFL